MNGNNKIENSNRHKDVDHHHSSIYNLFILVLTLFSLVIVTGIIIRPVNNSVLWWVDFLICMIFLLDFAISLWRAPNRGDYFFKKGGWLDLLGSIPAGRGMLWVVVFRFARLNRFIRIIKHLRGQDRGEMVAETRRTPAKAALLTMMIAAFVLITITSLLVLRLERDAPGANIRSETDAFWWALVTITTVGYGDYAPVTFWGRILAIVLMTFGIGIFAVLTSFVAAGVVRLHRDPEDVIAIVKEENAAIRAELAELKALIEEAETKD
jgi:voltage-gated potassium channel